MGSGCFGEVKPAAFGDGLLFDLASHGEDTLTAPEVDIGRSQGKPGGIGFKAQNNTQSIITDPDTVSRFSAELVAEHIIAQEQAAAAKKK